MTALAATASRKTPASADYPASVDYAGYFAAQPDTAPPVATREHDEAYILFTSGSTGEPKGVINSHFTWAHYSITAGLEIADTRPGEVFAHGAPLTHFTQVFVMPTFLRGGTNVMLPGLDVDGLLDAVERYRVTATAVVPTVVYLLLDHPRRASADLSSLRTMIYAGSPIAPDRLKEALDAFGPIFVQTYAGTEPGYVSCLRKEDHRVGDDTDRKRLASAWPIPYVQVAVTDEHDQPLPVGEIGEICSRQLGQLLGYLDKARTPEVLRDGWVHTGDIGYLDADGFLYIVDRKREMVVSGGFNIFPRQVEDAAAGGSGGRPGSRHRHPAPEVGGGSARRCRGARRCHRHRGRPHHRGEAEARQRQRAQDDRLRRRAAGQPVRQGGQESAARAVLVRPRSPGELMDVATTVDHTGPLPAGAFALRQRRGRRHRRRGQPPGGTHLSVVHLAVP